MFVGVDHSTTGVKVAIIGDDTDETFTLDRALLGDGTVSLVDSLKERVDIAAIDMAAITYSWGNAINELTDIRAVSTRGIKDHIGAGYELGGGTVAFDELQDSSIPAVVVPGVHEGLESLHRYFRQYSELAGGDKVADVRYAQELLHRDGEEGEHFIWACASSSCMSALVCEGQLRGFFWWLGLMHGWPDPDSLRRIEDGIDSVTDVLMRRGILYSSGKEFDEIRDGPDEAELELSYYATLHNVHSLIPFATELDESALEGVVLAGRLLHETDSFDIGSRLVNRCQDIAPTYRCEPYSATYGTAFIARDVYRGDSHVLGIPVGEVSV